MDEVSRGAVFEMWHSAAEYTSQQTDQELKAAPGAGKSLYITDIIIICNAAVNVTLEQGTSTLKFRHYGDAQGSGVAHRFSTPMKFTANTSLTLTTSDAVTAYVAVCGYTGKA